MDARARPACVLLRVLLVSACGRDWFDCGCVRKRVHTVPRVRGCTDEDMLCAVHQTGRRRYSVRTSLSLSLSVCVCACVRACVHVCVCMCRMHDVGVTRHWCQRECVLFVGNPSVTTTRTVHSLLKRSTYVCLLRSESTARHNTKLSSLINSRRLGLDLKLEIDHLRT